MAGSDLGKMVTPYTAKNKIPYNRLHNFQYDCRYNGKWKQEWIFISQVSLQKYLTANLSHKCVFPSRIRRRHYHKKGQSTRLNKLKYSAVSKPWNVQLSIHIFAPFNNIFPNKFEFPRLWLPYPFAENRATYSFNIFHLVVSRDKMPDSLPLKRIVEAVVYYSFGLTVTEVVYYLSEMQHKTNKQLITTSFGQTPDELIRFNVVPFLALSVDFCSQIASIKRKHFYTDPNWETRFEKIFLEVWQLSFGNYTMHHSDELIEAAYREVPNPQISTIQYCDQFHNKEVPFSDLFLKCTPRVTFAMTNISHFGWISLIKPTTDLRFVSCGNDQYSSLMFHELVNIFDKFTWLGIITTSMVLIMLSNWINTKCEMLWFLVKVGLEQGSPLSNNFLTRRFQVITGSTITLLAMVLTNAYKSTNMYNIILPKTRVARQTFGELYRDEFQIYCRLCHKHTIFDVALTLIYSEFPDQAQRTGDNFTYYTTWLYQNSYFETSDGYKPRDDDALTYFKKPKHIPSYENVLIRALTEKERGQEYHYIRYSQTLELIELLGKCDKVAIVLPYNEAIHVIKKYHKHISDRMDVGVESLFQKRVFMILDGMWPPYVLLRQKLVESESGIVLKWERNLNDSFVSKTTFRRMRGGPTSAKMGGNIRIIFFVYGMGMLLSLMSCLAETFKQCFRNFNFKLLPKRLNPW